MAQDSSFSLPVLSLFLLGSLGALGCDSTDRSDDVRETQQLLTPEEERTLRFELASDWRVWSGSGTISNDPLSSEGQNSLKVEFTTPDVGYVGVRNLTPITKDQEPAPEVVGYDVWVPSEQVNPWWHGNTELYIDAPSAGIWGQYLGFRDFNPLPKGEFVRVEFPLPNSIRTALDNSNYDDLRFVISVNTTAGSEPHYIDHFTLGPDPGNGQCTPVDDNNPCTVDACDPNTNQPIHTPVAPGMACTDDDVCNGTETCDGAGTCQAGTPLDPDDRNPCTADSCDPVTGISNVPVSAGTACDDDNVCNGAEFCDANGACQDAPDLDPDDGNPCTADSCDPVTGVANDPVSAGTSCADADVCNGEETCDGAGTCQEGPDLDVDDNNACTVDTCDAVLGAVHTPIDPDDGNACTVDACDPVTGVSNTPINPDDGNACTVDSCDPATGVVNVAIDPNDNNACTVDSCDPVTGVSNTPVDPDDGNACTVDSCDPATGVINAAIDPDDGDACTVDVCDPATGVSNTPIDPDDGNACTADSCDPATGVSNTAIDPDDSNACTVDSCDPSTGVSNTPIDPDDGNACTVDSCDPATGVINTPIDPDDNNACTVDACDPVAGVTNTPVAPDDGNICTVDSCDPATGVSNTPAAVGFSCEDGDLCNGAETCDGAGACQAGTPVSTDDGNACTTGSCDPATGAVTQDPVSAGTSCADGDVCNGDEVCDGAGVCAAGTPLDADDNNPCTDDTCDPLTGVDNTPSAAGTECEDGDVCNGIESCDGFGVCLSGAPLEVDDGNACTADSCDPVSGVVNTPTAAGTSCANGDVCDGDEVCDGVGSCQAGSPVDPDDGDVCTNDSCDPVLGVQNEPVPAGTSCSDGIDCNGEEACNADGACVTAAPPNPDDGNRCTVDSCDAQGNFVHTPLPVGTLCDPDGNQCDGLWFCDETATCINVPAPPNDGNPCTADSCDPELGNQFEPLPAGTSCADDDVCNGEEVCDGAGACQAGIPLDADDGDPCTDDTCDPLTGVDNTPSAAGTECEDGDVCNGIESCDGFGACLSGSPLDLDDGNACTDDACDPVGGVFHMPTAAGSSCDNGDVCDGDEVCDGIGSCQAGTPVDPDDGNACTMDSCDPVLGVQNDPEPVGTSCDDGDFCSGTNTCDGSGVCLSPGPDDLDDGNPCTIDACDAINGVTHELAEEGTPCSDGDACNGLEVCDAFGSCNPGTPPLQDDNNPCTDDTCDPDTGVINTPLAEGSACSLGTCEGSGACNVDALCERTEAPVTPDNDLCTLEFCDEATGVIEVVNCTENNLNVLTTAAGSMRFLYEGPDPAQQDVGDGVFDDTTASVVRGRVIWEDGFGIPNVRVEVLGHPEYGWTRTQIDGHFVLVVPGGEESTLSFTKDGFPGIFRGVDIAERAQIEIDDVVLVQRDHKSTQIQMGSTEGQLATATPKTDEDGTRTVRVYFPSGTQASLLLDSCTEAPMPVLTVRATEYTVGDRGEGRMPASLPPESAYTFATELTADEAIAAGTDMIEFNQSVYVYTDNFLGFEPGTIIPTGFVDEENGNWVASENGVTLRVDDIVGGVAELSGDEELPPEHVPSLEELTIIGHAFSIGAEFWRSPVDHFSKWDKNQGQGPPEDSEPPPEPPPEEPPEDDGPPECGSRIDLGDGNVTQDFPLVGTSEQLHHVSRRARSARTIDIAVTDSTIPASLKRVDVQIDVAGQQHNLSFPATPAQSHTFLWDGLDAMGREVQGVIDAVVKVSNVYDPVYIIPERFGYNGSASGDNITNIPGRGEIALNRIFERQLGSVRFPGLGQQSLSSHHFLDLGAGEVHLGTGEKLGDEDFGFIAELFAGRRTTGLARPEPGLFGPDTYVLSQEDLVLGNDGRVHSIQEVGRPSLSNRAYSWVVYDQNGVIESVEVIEQSGRIPRAMALTNDGRRFFADFHASSTSERIMELLPDGSLRVIADPLPGEPLKLAASPDGQSLYVVIQPAAVTGQRSIQRISINQQSCDSSCGIVTCPDQGLVPVLGLTGDAGGGCPTAANWDTRRRFGDINVADDGTLYFTTLGNTGEHWLCTLSASGELREVVNQTGAGHVDWTPVGIFTAGGISGGPPLISDPDYIYRLDPFLGLRHFALGHGGPFISPAQAKTPGALTSLTSGFSVADDGLTMFISEARATWRIRSSLPRYGDSLVVPSQDGSERYLFAPDGRHLETRNSHSGERVMSFVYDAEMQLIDQHRHAPGGSIVETITIQRDADGLATAILVDPDGAGTATARTHTLQYTPDGALEQITNPANETFTMVYGSAVSSQLITSMTEPTGRTKLYDYDAEGKLTSVTDAIAPGQVSPGTFAIGYNDPTDTTLQATSWTTPSGQETIYGREVQEGAEEEQVYLLPDATQSTFFRDDAGISTSVARDGTQTVSAMQPDPTALPREYATSIAVTLPVSGVTRTTTRERTGTLDNNIFVTAESDTQCIESTAGSLCTTVAYDSTTGLRTTTTPENRVTTEILDALDRLTELQAPGEPTVRAVFNGDDVSAIIIDPDGIEGNGDERTTTIEYDPSTGLLAKVIDPLTHETLFANYDGADRPQTITLPDTAQVQMTYDADGNVASVTPPGKAAHGMTYGPRGRIESYTPPVGNGVNFFYDQDRRMDLIDFGLDAFSQPNQVDFDYDPVTGQLSTITSPTGTINVGFTNGHMTSLSAPSMGGTIVTSIDYDGFLPTSLSWAGPVAGEVNWTYNDRFLIETETIEALPETTVTYQYDNDGLVTQAGDLEITRDPTSGRVVQKVIGRIRETFEYNEFAELSRQTVEFLEADLVTVRETLYDVVYDDDGVNGDRDVLGRITKKTEWIVDGDVPNGDGTPRSLNARTFDYGYNVDGRPWLESVAVDGNVVSSYGYDDNGNRTSVDLSWSQLGYDTSFDVSLTEADTVYDSADKLLQYGTKSYIWNSFGQLQSVFDAATNETTTYSYDLYGNLLAVALPDGRTIEYEVDGAGRRVGRREFDADGVQVSFRGWIYRDLLRPIAEVDEAGNVVARYIYEDGVGSRQNGVDQVATRLGANQDASITFSGSNVPVAIEVLDSSGAAVQTLVLATNQVGSVVLVLDASDGEVLQRTEYDAFGRVVFDSNPSVQPFGFAGGLIDADTYLVRFGARDYSADLGRWTARDPAFLIAQPDEVNYYQYGLSVPTTRTDPMGLLSGESECVNRCGESFRDCMKRGGSYDRCRGEIGPGSRDDPGRGADRGSAYARCKVKCGEEEPGDLDPNVDPICSTGL